MAVEGEIQGNNIDVSCVVTLSGEEAEKIFQKVENKIKDSLNLAEEAVLIKDEVTEKLWPEIKKIATELLIAKKLGQNVLLRFHGDADGICGAFALTDVLKCKTYQQNAAVYSTRDALRDIGTVGQEGKALIMLLDFASNEASWEAVNLLKAAGINVLIIDHHPLGEKKHKGLLNPNLTVPNSSRYVAGYLACEIAIACGMDIEKGRELAKIACTGDKSDLLSHDEDDVKKAMVLDFLAAHTSFGNNLDFYRKVMDNESLFSSIAQQAKESIEEAADKAMAKMKKTKENELEIITFQLDEIVTKGEWPPSGKITTCVFERLSKNNPLMCIGYNERSLIMRINNSAVVLGLSANELAKNITKNMSDFVEGGGGHDNAGAIRVKTGFSKDVLGEIIRQAGEIVKRK